MSWTDDWTVSQSQRSNPGHYCWTSPVDECNFCITFSFKTTEGTLTHRGCPAVIFSLDICLMELMCGCCQFIKPKDKYLIIYHLLLSSRDSHVSLLKTQQSKHLLKISKISCKISCSNVILLSLNRYLNTGKS